MSYHVFQYPLPLIGDVSDLNAFLAGNRIASVHRETVATASGPLLLFVVQVAANDARISKGHAGRSESRIDYRETLSDEQFAVFSRLRAEQKSIAESEGVPVYTVFSNAQLAEMVTRGVRSKSALGAIDGVGSARVSRYGDRMLAHLVGSAALAEQPGTNAE